MIVHSLRAQNVLKYARLEIPQAPDKGLIAISGGNESGKTAIAETLCFALFGRTFAAPPGAADEIIRWQADDCQTELRFTARKSQTYRVARALDRAGRHAAQLYRGDERQAYAVGPRAVEMALREACGFDGAQYLDALYWAQREIAATSSPLETIRALTGTSDLEEAAAALRAESAAARQRVSELDREINRTLARIAELEAPQREMTDIERQHQAARADASAAEQAIAEMQANMDDIQTRRRGLQAAGRAFAGAKPQTSLREWGGMVDEMDARARDLPDGRRDARADIETGAETDIKTTHATARQDALLTRIHRLGEQLLAFAPVQTGLNAYRERLAILLGEGGDESAYSELRGEPPLPRQHEALRGRLRALAFKRFIAHVSLSAGLALTLLGLLGWWSAASQAAADLNFATNWFVDFFTAVFGAPPPRDPWPAQMASAVFGGCLAIVVVVRARLRRATKQHETRLAALQERIDDLRARADLIDRADSTPLPRLVAGLERFGNKNISRRLKAYTHGAGAAFVDPAALAAEQDGLTEALNERMAAVDDMRESAAADIGRQRRVVEDAQARIAALDAKKQTLREREREVDDLREEINQMAAEKARCAEQAETGDLARRLLHGACRDLYRHFNQALAEHVGVMMARLTDNRYRRIRLGGDDDRDHSDDDDYGDGGDDRAGDLGARVFCQDKNDFADLGALSSGTQRQILLCLRLGLAKALIESGKLGRQFIMLDEPFAYFDRERVRATLAALPRVDSQLRQIWVSAQEFEDLRPFQLHIACSRDSGELVVDQSADSRVRVRS